MRGSIPQLDTCQCAVLMDMVRHRTQVADIARIPDTRGQAMGIVGLRMYGAVFGVDARPAALRLQRAVRRLEAGSVRARAYTVRHLVEPVAQHFGPDLEWLKEDVASVLCLPFRISLLHQYRPSVAARDPRGTCKRYTGNGRRLDRQGHQVLALEVMHVLFATRPGDHGRLQFESLEIVAYPARANRRLQALFQNRVLGRHADRTLTGLAVMAEPRCGAELVIVRGRGDLLAVLVI